MAGAGIEVYWITPGDILLAFAIAVLLALVATLGGMWVTWQGRDKAEPADDPERTVEIRPRSRTHYTGTVHGPQYARAEVEDTVPIETEAAR